MPEAAQDYTLPPRGCDGLPTPSKEGRIPLIGVDPGKHGGFAIIDPYGLAVVSKMPRTLDGQDIDYAMLAVYFGDLRLSGVHHAFCEQLVKTVAGRTQNAAATAVYAYNAGAVRGILESQRWQITTVAPMRWQQYFTSKHIRDVGTRDDWKRYLQTLAHQHFPHLKITLETCDALLIAKYGYHQLNK